MFGPRHTFQSVAKELVTGFSEGTILVRPRESPESDVENFESEMEAILARNRRRENFLLIAGSAATIASTTIALMSILSRWAGGSQASEPSFLFEVILLLNMVGAGSAFFSRFKTREKSIELKTYMRILKMADTKTAKRLVMQVASKAS